MITKLPNANVALVIVSKAKVTASIVTGANSGLGVTV